MTQSTQTKFMELMAKAAKFYDVEFIQDQNYANTGWVTFQEEGGFTPIVRFSYSFQTGNNVDPPYASFEGATGISNPKGRDDNAWHYVLQHELDDFVKVVRNALARYQQARRDAEFAEIMANKK